MHQFEKVKILNSKIIITIKAAIINIKNIIKKLICSKRWVLEQFGIIITLGNMVTKFKIKFEFR